MTAPPDTDFSRVLARRDRAVAFAPAKLNLRLRILHRRPDGYHDIDSLVALLDHGDLVSLSLGPRGNGCSLACPGFPELETGDNLALRAVDFFKRYHGLDRQVALRIVKRTPLKAGLGGGSSDAVATLKALSALHGVQVYDYCTPEALARELGADLPLFVSGGHKRIQGVGERCHALPGLPPWWVLLVTPPWSITTAELYHQWDLLNKTRSLDDSYLTGGRGDDSIYLPNNWDDAHLARVVANDFFEVVQQACPDCGEVYDTLAKGPCLAAGISGSGSTVFALYRQGLQAQQARSALKKPYITRIVSLLQW